MLKRTNSNARQLYTVIGKKYYSKALVKIKNLVNITHNQLVSKKDNLEESQMKDSI